MTFEIPVSYTHLAQAGNMGKAKGREMLFWTKAEYLKFAEAMMDKPLSYYCLLYTSVDQCAWSRFPAARFLRRCCRRRVRATIWKSCFSGKYARWRVCKAEARLTAPSLTDSVKSFA